MAINFYTVPMINESGTPYGKEYVFPTDADFRAFEDRWYEENPDKSIFDNDIWDQKYFQVDPSRYAELCISVAPGRHLPTVGTLLAGIEIVKLFDPPPGSMYPDWWAFIRSATRGTGSVKFVAQRPAEPLPWYKEPGDNGYGPVYPDRLTFEWDDGETEEYELSMYIPGDNE